MRVCLTHVHKHTIQQSFPHDSWMGLSNTPRHSKHSTSVIVKGELGGRWHSTTSWEIDGVVGAIVLMYLINISH